MRNIWWIFAVILVAFVVPARADAVPALSPDDMVMGKADAPITIIEYASLSCPHCAEFDMEILPKVKAEWIDTGKAKLAFRDYPLDQPAVKAAQLAHCAPKERFFGFVDELFHSQRNWVLAGNPEEALERIGRLGGVSPDKFKSCMNDKQLQDKIINSRLVASQQYDVSSTPTFFINGKKVVGALPYDDFAKALTAALASAPKSELPGRHLATAAPPSQNE
ncbi:MAG TPA: DsbA family protein [Stellaceae bacterium]|nr:DsbA family protein [Stellaceae bacterium]